MSSTFALRPGAAGPGLADGLAALADAIGADEVTRALGRALRRGPATPVLEIGAASRIRGAAYLLWDDVVLGPSPELDALEDAARTEHVFWGRDDFEPYRVLTAPLPSPLPGAVPDERARWVVVEGMTPQAARVRSRAEGLDRAQLHVFAPRSLREAGLDRAVVRWSDRAATVAAVLGRASMVLAPDGALLDDAIRLGRPFRCVGEPLPRARERRIATLAPVLLEDPAFVGELVARGPTGFADFLADRGFRGARLDASVARGFEGERFELMQRRIRKFRQEPDRFFAESRFPLIRSGGQLFERVRRKP